MVNIVNVLYNTLDQCGEFYIRNMGWKNFRDRAILTKKKNKKINKIPQLKTNPFINYKLII